MGFPIGFEPKTATNYQKEKAMSPTANPVGELDPMNVSLRALDEAVIAQEADAQKQIALAVMLCVLAVRRFLIGNAIFDRGRRLRVLKAVVVDFESKLRRYVRSAD